MRCAWWGFCLMVMLTAVTVGAEGVKYDPQFGNAWEAALRQKAPKRWLECVIRVQRPPTPEEMAQLKAAFFHPRSILHDVITGSIRAGHVDQLLKLPFVVSIEGGGMGGPKKTQGMK